MTWKGFPPRPARLLTTLGALTLLTFLHLPAAALDTLLQREQQAQRERDYALRPRFSPGLATDPAIHDDTAAGGPCIPVTRIEVRGATLPPGTALAQFTRLPGKGCVDAADLKQRLQRINQWYLSHGFITSRARITPQDLGDGILRIDVTEGRVEALHSGAAGLSSRRLRQVFPRRSGDRLNLRDLEQGLDNLNRLRSIDATLELLPGASTGASRIAVDAKSDTPWFARLGFDTGGQTRTGKYRGDMLLARDNPLGYLGFMYVYLQRDIGERGADPRAQAWQLHYDVPYGYLRFNLDVAGFRYAAGLEGLASRVMHHGRVRQYSFGAQRVLYRNAVSVARAGLQWRRRDTDNRIGDVRLDSSSVDYNTGALSIDYERFLRRGHFNARFGIDRGVNSAQRHRFRRHWLELRTTGDLERWPGVRWRQQVFAQGAAGRLYSAEQIAIGGQYSVRGFRDGGLSGTRGMYWRQTISVALDAGDAPWLPGRIGLGFDVGRVNSDRHGWRSLRGVGVEWLRRWRGLSLSVSLNRAIGPPSSLGVDRDVFLLALQYSPG